jgi:hypothetical protein
MCHISLPTLFQIWCRNDNNNEKSTTTQIRRAVLELAHVSPSGECHLAKIQAQDPEKRNALVYNFVDAIQRHFAN